MKEASLLLDDLSNWYVRRNRRRFWKSENDADKLIAYDTLYSSLVTIIKVMAPIIPFLTEEIYNIYLKCMYLFLYLHTSPLICLF